MSLVRYFDIGARFQYADSTYSEEQTMRVVITFEDPCADKTVSMGVVPNQTYVIGLDTTIEVEVEWELTPSDKGCTYGENFGFQTESLFS